MIVSSSCCCLPHWGWSGRQALRCEEVDPSLVCCGRLQKRKHLIKYRTRGEIIEGFLSVFWLSIFGRVIWNAYNKKFPRIGQRQPLILQESRPMHTSRDDAPSRINTPIYCSKKKIKKRMRVAMFNNAKFTFPLINPIQTSFGRNENLEA